MDPHQANLQPHLLLLNSLLCFNPTPTSLGVTFNLTFSFSQHVSSLKVTFFPRLKTIRCICASSSDPSQVSLSLLHKAFLRPLFTNASRDGFLFLALPTLPNWNALTERVIAPLLAASLVPLSHFSSLRGSSNSPTSYPNSFCSVIL